VGLHDREHVEVASASQLRTWFDKNHEQPDGVWIVTFKKTAGQPAPTYEEMVREALCFGWVDSMVARVDELRTKTYFSPRRRKSPWSPSNRARVEELMAQGMMHPHGLRTVEEAKANGTWPTTTA